MREDLCLHQLIERQAARTPDQVALAFEDQWLTYAELNRRADRLAQHLRGLKVGPEVLVGLFVERSLEMVVGLLGILKAGAAYVPIDPASPQGRVAFMLTDANVAVILTQRSLLAALSIDAAQVVCLDAFDWTDRSDGARPNDAGVQPHNLAYVIYTSGSTGRPKGVCVEHRNIVNYVLGVAERLRLEPGMNHATVSTIAADLGNTVIFPALATGGCLHVISQERAESQALLSECFTRERIDVLKIVPSHLAALQTGKHPERVLPRQRLIVGGEASRRDWIERLRAMAPSCEIYNHYGPTETTVGVLTYHVGSQVPRTQSGTLPLGQPLPNSRVYVLDGAGHPVSLGDQGELYIGGCGVARGYLNRPDLTAERFVPDPFSRKPNARLYRTGDACRYIPDRSGHIEFLGRLDYQVKLRGFRIELGEIEAAMLRHPDVRETVVLERMDSTDDKRLIAYFVSRSGRPGVVGEIREFLKHQLPDYMVPGGFVVMDALPLTPNGKVDRKALPPPQEQNDSEPATMPPRDVLEAKLVDMWETILDARPVGVRDNFFEIGGHSLLAERLTAQIRREFKQTIKLSTFFQQPTIEQVANLLRARTTVPSISPLAALQAQGSLPPFFCVHSLSGDAAIFSNLARSMPANRPFYGFQTLHPSELGDESPSIEAMAGKYVDAMITAQPQGPYHLGGYSFGCVIAFEMAQQLRERGLAVGLLVLMDGISPRAVRRMGGRGDAVTFAGIVRDWARAAGVPFSLPHDEVRRLSAEEGLDYILAKVKAANLLGPEQDIDWVRRFLKGIAARTRAIRSYEARMYNGTITLFRSTQADPENAKALIEAGMDVLDQKRGWDKLTNQPLDLHLLPGHHATLLQSPAVEYLAHELSSCLDAVGTVLQK